MSRQSKILVLLILVAALAVTAMGCGTTVSVVGVTIGGEYQVDYFIGDDLNITGMELYLEKSNGTEEVVLVQDVMSDVKFLNFDTTSANDELVVTLRYKSIDVEFIISVESQDYSDSLCTITFETFGGTEIDSIEVALYSTISLPTEPTKAGYGFGSWYEDEFLSNEWNFQLDQVQGDMTLYAEWLYQYTITFYAQPKEYSSNYVYTTRLVNEGGTLSSIPAVPSVEGSTGSWDRNSYSNIQADISVYPTYVVDTYSVIFYDNGSGDSVKKLEFNNVEYGTDLLDEDGQYYEYIMALQTTLETNPTKEHYSFVGWISNGATVDLTKVTGNISAYTSYEIDKFNITYMWNTTESDISVYTITTDIPYGSLLVEPTQPTRDGYVFMGWFTNADTTNQWVFADDKLTGTQIMYASWLPSYTVQFYEVEGDYYGGEYNYAEYLNYTVSEGSSLVMPAVPTIEGYTGKWDIVSLNNITANIEIYPLYTINEYTVTFVANDETISTQQVKYKEAAVAPEEDDLPAVEGSVFHEWNVEFDSITAALTVVAVYVAEEVIITYDYNVDSMENTQDVSKYGLNISFISNPVRSGYDFDGWYFDEATLTQCTTDYVLVGDVTLYAKWTMLFTITVNYYETEDDYNNDNFTSTAFTIRSGETIDEETYMPTTYAAYGKAITWLNEADNTEFSFSTKILGTYTLYPAYTDAIYTVTFVYDDGVNQDYVIQVYHGNTVTNPTTNPSLTGSTFLGWYKSGESVKTDFDTNVIIEETTIFYAKYEVNKYTVQFVIVANSEMGIEEDYIISEQTINHGDSASQPQASVTAIHEGYSFTGWKLMDGSSASLSEITDNMVCYASYTINTYEIKFISDDRQDIYYTTAAADEVEYGGSPEVYVGDLPTKTGYTFKGWDYSGTYTGIVTATADIPKVTADLVVYAVFEINTYSIKFDVTDSGGVVNTQYTNYNTTTVQPVDPTWKGTEEYSFLGWYSDSELTQKFDFSTPITEDITLYSKWASKVDAMGASFTYDIDESNYTLFVNGISNITSTTVIIPNYVSVELSDGSWEILTVIGIGASALSNETGLKVVYLPSTLQFIGVSAFSGCSNITSVSEYGRIYMPDGLVEVGENAFSNCTSLTSITFDSILSELTTIGNNAFSAATSLVSFTLPSVYSITIGDSAFFGCTSLLSFDFGANVISIGENAFKNNTALRYVTFSRTRAPELSGTAFSGVSDAFRIYVINIDNYAASDLNTAGWTTYASRVIAMEYISDDGSWSYSINATGITLVQYLGTSTEVYVPSTLVVGGEEKQVTAIADYSFDKSITSIIFSTGNVSLTQYTLAVASGLLAITIEGTDQYNNNLMVYIAEAFNIAHNLTSFSYIISNDATLSALFNGSVPSGLTTITILDGTSLPDYMFKDCKFLITVTLPAVNDYTIGDYAFSGCENLVTVMFSEGTSALNTSIGVSAFEGAVSLASYVGGVGLQILDANVTEIGVNALKNTTVLTQLEAASDTVENKGFVIIDNILYSYYNAAVNASDIVVIPSTVIAINEYAFYNDSTIRAIIFDTTNTSLSVIGEYAFDGCYNLETIVLPAALTSIGNGAFDGCVKLVKVISLAASSPVFTSGIFDDAISNIELYVYELYKDAFISLASETNKSAIVLSSVYYSSDNQFIVGESDSSGKTALYYIGSDSTVTVDSSYDSIANYAFSRFSEIGSDDQYISSLVIEDCDVIISQYSFNFLRQLTSLSLDNTTDITYANAVYLYNMISTNSNLATIAFDGANTLTNIIANYSLPSYVVNIDLSSAAVFTDYLLLNQYNIANIILPATIDIDKIGLSVFDGTAWAVNETLTSDFITINITASTSAIIYYGGNDSIVTIPDDSSIYAIGKGVFQNNTDIEMLIIDANITYIAEQAFYDASQLTKVVVKAYGGEIYVASDAFSGTADGIETIKALSAITTVVGDAIEATLYNDGDVYFTYQADLGATIQFIDNQTDIIVPTTVLYGEDYVDVVKVGNNAFSNITTSLTFSVGYDWDMNAIENLKNVKTLTLELGYASDSDNPIELDDAYKMMFSSFAMNNASLSHILYEGGIALAEVFDGNAITSVTTITITEGAENLVNYLLEGFISVATINIPDSLQTLGYYMFEQTAWYSAQNNTNYIIMSNGWLYKYTGSDSTPTMPASVVVISSYAFATYDSASRSWIGNTNMTTLQFAADSALTTIKYNAFYDCKYLTYINLPTTATNFEDGAFNSCGIVADGDMLYVKSASNDYTLIKYTGSDSIVEIDDNVKVIADSAFENNTNLTELVFTADSKLSVIGANAFAGCTNLTTITLPETVTEIGANALNDTEWFTNADEMIIINNRLVLYTGNGNDSDSFVYKYDYVTSIAQNAFNSCDIKEIYIETYHSDLPMDNDTEIAMNSFETIYIESSSVESFKEAWATCADKIVGY